MRNRKILSAPLALIVLSLTAGVALGHHVNAIQGTVDCEGNYSITVTGDVFGTTNLIVWLDGKVIFDGDTGQVGSVTSTYGPFTGVGATAGQSIEAKAQDNPNTVSGTLTLSQETCATPSPTPDPSIPDTATGLPTPTFAPDGIVFLGTLALLGAMLWGIVAVRRSLR